MGGKLISTASSLSDASGPNGAFSPAGAQTLTGVASIGVSLARATPVVGQVLSGLSIAEDWYGTVKEIGNCQ